MVFLLVSLVYPITPDIAVFPGQDSMTAMTKRSGEGKVDGSKSNGVVEPEPEPAAAVAAVFALREGGELEELLFIT